MQFYLAKYLIYPYISLDISSHMIEAYFVNIVNMTDLLLHHIFTSSIAYLTIIAYSIYTATIDWKDRTIWYDYHERIDVETQSIIISLYHSEL